jgi:YVTN family beta-propeller protein
MRAWMLSVAVAPLLVLAAFHAAAQTPAAPPAASLDYEFFKTRVQPVFLARRPGHARCYACHALGAGEGDARGAMRLQVLSPGSTAWNEEQSRSNFDVVRTKVVPGNPRASRLLIHPLRHQAGGDESHGGGPQFSSANEPEWQVLAAWVRGETGAGENGGGLPAAAAPAPRPRPVPRPSASGLQVRIIQTNMAGDNLHIIDPATNRIIAEISGIEANHGVSAAPDGSRLYVTNEADRTVDVVDMTTLRVVKQIPLSGPPNNMSISKDGRRVYQAIHAPPNGIDIIDTATLTNAKHLPLDGMRIHNTFVTPDGRWVIAASDDNTFTAAIIDQKTETHVRSITFGNRPRPLSFSTNPDGSTKWIFAGLTGLHGFVVVDFETGKELRRIPFPDLGGQVKMQVASGTRGNPNHGIGVQPDNRVVWVSDRWYNFVHAYALPDLTHLGAVPVDVDPFWITFTPDSRYAYVSNAASATLSVIDTQALREVARIPVGFVPKRVVTAMLPF